MEVGGGIFGVDQQIEPAWDCGTSCGSIGWILTPILTSIRWAAWICTSKDFQFSLLVPVQVRLVPLVLHPLRTI